MRNDLAKRIIGAVGRRLRLYFSPNPERDVFLVSYPRSGNTWARAIVAHIETGNAAPDLRSLDYIVPDSHLPTPRSRLVNRPRYIVKSHAPWTPSFRKVIYVGREPAQVLLSRHAHLHSLGKTDLPIEQFALEWLAGRVWPCSWREHIRSWIEYRSRSPDTLVVGYHQLRDDPAQSIARIARFLQKSVPADKIAEIVAATGRDAMRRMEIKGTRHQSLNLEFIGSGLAGSRGTLPPDIQRMVEDECGDTWRSFVARCEAE